MSHELTKKNRKVVYGSGYDQCPPLIHLYIWRVDTGGANIGLGGARGQPELWRKCTLTFKFSNIFHLCPIEFPT